MFALLMWLLTRVAKDAGRNRLPVVFAAVIFSVAHLAQPGVSWLQLPCITSTGTLYGWIGCRSRSTAQHPRVFAGGIESGALRDQRRAVSHWEGSHPRGKSVGVGLR